MWIKTADRLLEATGEICVSTYQHTFTLNIGQYTITCGTKEEMTAVLDRIARALAAGLPFLDLGEPDPVPAILGSPTIEAIMQDAKANTLRIDRYRDAWCAALYVSGGDCVQEATGPTPDAAIANLKPTKENP